VVTGGGLARPLPGRGQTAGLRFTLYALASVVLMFLDQRGNWLEYARYGLSAAAYPIQLAVDSPSAAWRWIRATFESRAALQAENAGLRERVRAMELRTLSLEALEAENAKLRSLRAGLPPVVDRWLAAEIINVELSSLRQRVLLNKGARAGVFRGQAVLADGGLLGQVVRVSPWTAEVILVSDPEHAVPVQVLRSGLRTIAVGQGSVGVLALPYLPINSDIRTGDQLVSSGLGGVFPAGYPVAKVLAVDRDPGDPLAQVRAQIAARLARDRVVMLVWFTPGHPSAPAPLEALAEAAAATEPSDGASAAPAATALPAPVPPREPDEVQE
jgi:rod shape-determining protein MreC